MSLPAYKALLLAAKKDPTPKALAALHAEAVGLAASGDHVRAYVLSQALVELGGQAVAVPDSPALLAWKQSLEQAPVPPPGPPAKSARELWRAAREEARAAADAARAEKERARLTARACRGVVAEVAAEPGDGKVYLVLEVAEQLAGAGALAQAAELVTWASAHPASAAAAAEVAATTQRLAPFAVSTAAAKAAAEAAVAALEASKTEAARASAADAVERLFELGAVGAALPLAARIGAVAVQDGAGVVMGGGNG